MPNEKDNKLQGPGKESQGRARRGRAEQARRPNSPVSSPQKTEGTVQTTKSDAPQQKRRGRPPKAHSGTTPQNSAAQVQNSATPLNGAQQKSQSALTQNQGRPQKAQSKAGRGRKPQKAKKPLVRFIPLGGLSEVGKNINVVESAGESFIIDCGLTFPDESMPGVDLVIPDFTYVLEKKDSIKAIFITHGHEDHIGALPFLLKQAKFPIYATKLTVALIEGKLKEHNLLGRVQLNVVKPGDIVSIGQNKIEFIGVNHSIPDAVALALHTPAGVIIHTGDFKIDFTPIRGDIINLARFGELGCKGVLCLMADSTNVERPGFTMSEKIVGESFDKLFAQHVGKRILVATFSSNVHRVQQIVDAAVKYGRKVAVQGRSMENVINKALEIGYLDIPAGVLIDVDMVGNYLPSQIVIITTGSQGEPMSALTRMAMGDHRKVTVGPEDCIIISATPIPGNEKLVTRVVNELFKLGAVVVYEKMFDVHVSGHANLNELKTMHALTKPQYFMPVHGEYKHLKKHKDLAVSMGMPPENVLVTEIGKVVEISEDGIKVVDSVTAGKVFVDGLGVGDVGSIVLRDRKHLAEDGLIVVVTTVDTASGQILSGPDIVSRGFVYVRESEDMIGRARTIARDSIEKCMKKNSREWGTLKQRVRDDLGDYFWQVTKRSPMILPVIQEVD